MGELRIGCSGWNYPHWRGVVYPKGVPERVWLEHYATLFDTVEVNSSFYRLPRRSAVAHWVEQTPAGFVFTVKASRYLTHIRRLRSLDEGLPRLRERIEPLEQADRLGPLLWQLPATFHRDDDRLAEALGALGRGRHAFEFRDPSWFCDPVYERLRAHGAALVIGDHPERPFQTEVLTADFTLLRMHHGSRGRRGNYSEAELDGWAGRIRRLCQRGDVFVYFNNDWEGFAVANARYLRRALALPTSTAP